MENKPKTFKDAALSHIPQDIIASMTKQSAISTDGLSPLEAIAKELGKGPLPVKSEVSKEQFVTIAINNTAIKVSTDPYQGAMTLFAYLLATVWSKDKKIEKILKSFNFSFQDANGQIIYPKVKRNGRK